MGLAILASAAFLSGCGFVRFEQREPWRGEAEVACMKAGIVQESEFVRITKPIDGSGACGLDIPLKVQAFQIDQSILQSFAQAGAPLQTATGADLRLTVLKPEATLTCPMVAWLDDWLATAVQPAALAWMGQGVKEIRTAGSYACRRRNHQPGAKLSEHAFGNAIDIMSFVFADGSVTTVKGGWRGGTPSEQGFLRDVLNSACGKFRTVLGPGSDAFHYDHFHLDLARHDARGQRRYCRPRVEAPERPQLPPVLANPMPLATAYNTAPAAPQGFPSAAYSTLRPQQGYATNPYAAPQPPVAVTQRPPAPLAPAGSLERQQQMLQRDGLAGQAENGVIEQEEEFDPRDFDLTSSTPELPVGRGRGILQQPLPPASTGLLPAPPRAQPQRSVPRTAPVRQPVMPMGGN